MIGVEPRDSGKLVRTRNEVAQEAEGGIRASEIIWTGGFMREHFAKDRWEIALMKEVGSNGHAVMGVEAMMGEADPDGRGATGSANIYPHCLVRLLWRPQCLVFVHTTNTTRQCITFSIASFRLGHEHETLPHRFFLRGGKAILR